MLKIQSLMVMKQALALLVSGLFYCLAGTENGSWEETVYPKLSGKIGAHIDNTKFWDMGTPDRLTKLREFLKTERSRA